MGKRGPKPTPTLKLKARGSWLADRRRDEPQPEPGVPARPSWLKADEKAAWDYIVPYLEGMGTLARSDLGVLMGYAVHYAEWIRGHRKLQRPGKALSGVDRGRLVAEMRGAFDRMLRCAALLGLSVAERARLSVPGASEKHPQGKDRFFGSG